MPKPRHPGPRDKHDRLDPLTKRDRPRFELKMHELKMRMRERKIRDAERRNAERYMFQNPMGRFGREA